MFGLLDLKHSSNGNIALSRKDRVSSYLNAICNTFFFNHSLMDCTVLPSQSSNAIAFKCLSVQTWMCFAIATVQYLASVSLTSVYSSVLLRDSAIFTTRGYNTPSEEWFFFPWQSKHKSDSVSDSDKMTNCQPIEIPVKVPVQMNQTLLWLNITMATLFTILYKWTKLNIQKGY